MRRLVVVVLLTVLSSGRSGLWAGQPATAPASGPAGPTTQPAAPPPAHVIPPKRAELLRRARAILKLNRQLLKLVKAGQYARCKPILAKILALDPKNNTAWYNLACVHARLNEPEKAIHCLEKAVDYGFSDFRHIQRDPDLDAIRYLPAYEALLGRNEQIQRQRAEKIKAALKQRFGAGYIVEVDHANKLVFATNIDRQTLEELRRYLTAYAQAQWRDLFSHRFEQYVTIVVPAAGSVIPRRLGLGGFYVHGQRMLVARRIGMIMTHEFTHALHDADQDGLGQRHPIWITEGLATLFESSVIRDGHVIPQPNHRLAVLKHWVARGKTLPWARFVKLNHAEFMRKAAIAYAQCRYMMMYLYTKGLLKRWYDAYTEQYEQDRTGAKALEEVFGKKLSAIQADWLKWVRRLKSPPLRLRRDSAYIGVQTRSVIDGLKIVRVVPGSGAEKAGLRPGDVITNIDGRRIADGPELLRVVSQHRPGDKVSLRFRRNGEYHIVALTLGRWTGPPRGRPKARSRPAPAGRSKPPVKGRRKGPATVPTTQPAKRAA